MNEFRIPAALKMPHVFFPKTGLQNMNVFDKNQLFSTSLFLHKFLLCFLSIIFLYL